MINEITNLPETASQTAGPYVHIGLAPKQAGFDIFEHNFSHVMANEKTLGERITLEGTVTDGSGALIRDVLIEAWQANAAGKYSHPADTQKKPLDPDFRGWGRACSDFETGLYQFETIKPGPVQNPDGSIHEPHIALYILARGINIGLHTRVYFSDEEKANSQDPILNGIEWVARRKTLIAQREERQGKVVYRFNISVQGDQETVFFDI
jgi:protocatechuate 3,4-dioxygenase alpha subunit